jgi:hypothetical protein
MSAPSDHSNNSSLGARVLWLGQVSEAATALAGTRVAKQLSDIGAASKVSTEPIAPAKSISLSVRPDDSFNPAVHLTKSHVRSGPQLVMFTRLIIILAVAVTTLIVTGELSPTDIRQWLTSDSVIDIFSLPVTSDPVTAIAAERAKPRLIIQPSYGTLDQPAPLGLAVQEPAVEAVVYIEGLVPGMELSTGSPVGADAWEIPATELGYAWIAPPQGFVGTAKLIAELRLPDNHIADRQAIDVAWQSPISPAPVLPQFQERAALQALSPDSVHIQPDRDEAVSSQPLVTAGERLDGKEVAVVPSMAPAPVHLQADQYEVRPSKLSASTLRQIDSNEIGAVLEPIQLKPDPDQIVAANASAPALQPQLDGEEIILLLKRGKDLIATGDLAAARLVLRKAADANNAEAALALAATYDPFVLRELKVYGFTPDAAMARLWYEKATELGSPAAPRRLEMLTQGTGTR